MNWQLPFSSDTPVFRQIAEQISHAIAAGELEAGSQLPAERTLSEQLSVSRGTVRAAYRLLEQNRIIRRELGAGSFVLEKGHTSPQHTAEALLDQLWRIFDFLELSPDEIDRLIKNELWKRVPLQERLPIAWTECNPELLELTTRQITETCSLPVSSYLLQDVLDHPEEITAHNVLIAVPIGHHEEVQQVLPDFPMERIAMRVSNRTISYLSLHTPSKPVAIIYQSERFLSLVHRNLDFYHLLPQRAAFSLSDRLPALIEHLTDYGSVIFPLLQNEPPLLQRLHKLCSLHHIRMTPFEFLLDRGSLMHLEEYARQLWFHPSGFQKIK